MDLLECSDVYWEFLGQCTECGHCTQACDSLTAATMTLGDIAKGMLQATRGADSKEDVAAALAINQELTQAVRGCFFCTSCKNVCFAHNDVCELVYHARVDFQNLGLIPRSTWSSVEVDKEWDIFTAYRAVHGIDLSNMTRHIETANHEAASDCEIAFFPGCSLAAYAPELCQEIFDTIEDLGGKTTMIDHCCGSPLKSAGFYDRAEALCNRNVAEIASSGAKQLVCVCPGCANAMRRALEQNALDIDVISLPAYLQSKGFTSKHSMPQTPLYLSKSCQDRDGSYLAETLDVLHIDKETPSIFHGCCGAGGAVSSFQPERQDKHADTKLSFAEDGSTVISMCPTCTYTYAYHLLNNPRDLTNKHYAELLFENQIDWDTVFSQLNSMWSGEYGPWLAHVFA